jgi:hypothetical protein
MANKACAVPKRENYTPMQDTKDTTGQQSSEEENVAVALQNEKAMGPTLFSGGVFKSEEEIYHIQVEAQWRHIQRELDKCIGEIGKLIYLGKTGFLQPINVQRLNAAHYIIVDDGKKGNQPIPTVKYQPPFTLNQSDTPVVSDCQ